MVDYSLIAPALRPRLPHYIGEAQKEAWLGEIARMGPAEASRAAAFLSCLRPVGLYAFASEFCGFRDGGQFHRELCKVADSGPHWALWLLPRGHFKSSFLTVSESLRRAVYYWHNQEEFVSAGGVASPPPDIGIVSWKKGLAEEFLGQIRTICEQPIMSRVFPHAIAASPRSQHKKWLTDDITFLNGARIRAYTVESLPTGFHVTDLFGDDMVTRESVNTSDLIARTRESYGQLLSVLNPGCPFWMVGTRYHHLDLYSDLMKSNVWYKYIQGVYGQNGEPIFHERFNQEYLEIIEREQGPYMFSCQYLLNPIATEDQVFRPEWMRMDAPGSGQGGTITLTIDPAISMKESACDTAITVVESVKRGEEVHRYLRARVRGRMNPSEIVESALSLAETFGAHEIGVEAIQYQAALEHYMGLEMKRRGRYFQVTPIKSYQGRSKFDRIKGLQPEFSRGLWHLEKGSHDDVVSELLGFPQGAKVDVIDAMSMHLELKAYKEVSAASGGSFVDWYHSLVDNY